jgi:hypothetical protein
VVSQTQKDFVGLKKNGLRAFGAWEPLSLRMRLGAEGTSSRIEDDYAREHTEAFIKGLKQRGFNLFITHFSQRAGHHGRGGGLLVLGANTGRYDENRRLPVNAPEMLQLLEWAAGGYRFDVLVPNTVVAEFVRQPDRKRHLIHLVNDDLTCDVGSFEIHCHMSIRRARAFTPDAKSPKVRIGGEGIGPRVIRAEGFHRYLITVRIGDLNGDGAPDLLFAQTLIQAKPGSHELVCRTRELGCQTGHHDFGRGAMTIRDARRGQRMQHGRNGVTIHANRRPLAIPTLYNNTADNVM